MLWNIPVSFAELEQEKRRAEEQKKARAGQEARLKARNEKIDGVVEHLRAIVAGRTSAVEVSAVEVFLEYLKALEDGDQDYRERWWDFDSSD